jgi:hypothetical protein
MLHQSRRARGLIDVIPEQKVGMDDIEQLNVSATPAQKQIKGIYLLRLVHLRRRNIGINWRRWSELQHKCKIGPLTQSA